MKHIGWFSEMGFNDENGISIKKCLTDRVSYDKNKVIDYLKTGKRVAGCPREAVDCVTGTSISLSYSVYTDGIYDWCDFLIYYIENYNIELPADFIEHILKYAA